MDNPAERLATLTRLLSEAPDNPSLLADTASAALDARRPDVAADLVTGHAKGRPLTPELVNIAGIAAMQSGDFAAAASHFTAIRAQGIDAPALRFNLAWCKAMGKDGEAALALLDTETVAALPGAAMLQIQLLHDRGAFEEAAAQAHAAMARHGTDRGLMAAISTLAMDIEDRDLAERTARAAGDHPEALTTLATLALGEDRAAEAEAGFNQAIAAAPGLPRAWVGRGLARLMTSQAEAASTDIDKGAELFGDHIGSWIAAGWAHFVAGNIAASRDRFERALALDDAFAESHGALAVIDVIEGRSDSARRRSDIALRLDRQCFGAALARVLLAQAEGDAATAEKIYRIALNTPLDDNGRTIASALAHMGLG